MEKQGVSDVARLARIQLSESETEKFQHQLTDILDFFGVIAAVNTDGVEPMFSPLNEPPSYRKDEAQSMGVREDALGLAPEKNGNLYQVPPVV